jgi:sec-independent protein translocase protein TatA
VPFGISWVEVLLVAFVVLLVFGPKRLPEMGRSLGKGMREFKESITGNDDKPASLPQSQEEAPAPAPTRRDEHVS